MTICEICENENCPYPIRTEDVPILKCSAFIGHKKEK